MTALSMTAPCGTLTPVKRTPTVCCTGAEYTLYHTRSRAERFGSASWETMLRRTLEKVSPV